SSFKPAIWRCGRPVASYYRPMKTSRRRIDCLKLCRRWLRFALFPLLALAPPAFAAERASVAAGADDQQLPRAMHAKMKERPTITVGRSGAGIIGADDRAL